jgi:hopanoid biosynthesis associated RND transporter like protein HpnN
MTTSQELSGQDVSSPQISHGPITRVVVAIVMACARHKFLVVSLALLLTLASGWYAANNFAINTNTDDFISASVPWRQNEIAYDKAFPDQNNQIIVVVDGQTPELAQAAARDLTAKLDGHPNLFKSVLQPDGGPFFAQNGLLFQSTEQVQQAIGGLERARPVLGIIASDPSLRGVFDGFGFLAKGVLNKQGTLDQYKEPITSMNEALADILAGKPGFFSWQKLLAQGAEPSARETRKFIQISPVLDYSALEPGEAPTSFIRQAAADLNLNPAHGVNVRITGQVPISDAEFATVSEGFGVNGAITGVIVLLIIYSALKSLKIVGAVFVTVIAGLAVTFAAGLLLVHTLNVISIAFAVLFVGIGVDFGIQFSVRYRAERYDCPDFFDALHMAAAKVGRPLALAAVATMAGFYAFLPTTYRGVSELGEIAGTGMLIAFLAAITLLPALLTIIKPAAEREPVGYKFLAPVDDFIERHRYVIVIGTLALAIAATPLLRGLRFDFNPLNLDSQSTEAVSTLLDLMKDPQTDTQTISVLEPNLAAADATAQKLAKLPDVARVTTLSNLVPEDQQRKLQMIARGNAALGSVLNPAAPLDPPTDAESIDSIRRTAALFKKAAGDTQGAGADAARRFATLASQLADAAPAVRQRAADVFIPPLKVTVQTIRDSLKATPVSLDTIPAGLKGLYVSRTTGQARVEAAPKGDPNDNANMIEFAREVQAVAPKATGQPVAIQEAGKTVKEAFIEAGIIAIASIFVILWIVLRRVGDVLLTLVPLLLAGLVTLEITVLLKMPLNFANIIALPLLLGLGVAFKIYFVMAWRAGTKKLLQSSLTRAVFWSALTTATAFGSLWASHHPGTSSMGKLMALSLVCTLCAAILFQPALMGPPRQTEIK